MKREPPKTLLDFSAQGGFAAAVEMCNGVGVCRKKLEGTMCPSYMATRDEEHSTRGRANALRAVLSGRAPAGFYSCFYSKNPFSSGVGTDVSTYTKVPLSFTSRAAARSPVIAAR